MGQRGDKEFSSKTIKEAFARQAGYCASCGIRIPKLGNAGAKDHYFGERAEAHHVRPVLAGGTAQVENCVILCRTCHYSAHQAGQWSDISIYKEIGGDTPVYASTETIAAEYPFYKFTPDKAAELEELNRRGP